MKTKDWLLFTFVGLIWGTSFLWIKIAVQEVSPFVLVSFRTLFAALGLVVYLLIDRKARMPWKEIAPRLPVFIVLGLVNVAIPWLLISWAEMHIESGVASILNATMPLWTIIIAPLVISDDKITLPKLAGLTTGFIGVVLLFLPSIGEGWSTNLLGQAAVLGATLCYASATIFAHKKAHGLNPQTQTFLQFTMSTLIVWSLTLGIEKQITLPALPITWLALLWLGLLGSGFAYIIYFSLLHRLGPTRLSMVTYIPPVVGVLLGIIFLGEAFHWQALVGALLILSGISIVNLKSKEKLQPA
ncbi:MAG: DMT family transporter [Anaerolineaceae bacterium]|nr:DMT family transporter [Anaerolineaceae bacterium]